MRRTPIIVASLVVAVVQASAAQSPERFSIPGSSVAVYNLAGAVSVEAGTGANVIVEVVRGGPDASRLNLTRSDVDGRAALIVHYPAGDVVYDNGRSSRTTMDVRRDGTFFGRGDRGDRVTIRSSGSGTRAHADVRILVPAGKAVAVRLGVGTVNAGNVDGGLDIDVAAASVRTSRTRGRLQIDTGSGNVTVDGAMGDVLVDTGSGSVEVNDIRGDDLTVDTGSGSVRGSGISAPTVSIDTGSGRISLSGVSARDVSLDTGSGSVEIDLASRVERLRIDTGSGGVRVTVPADFGAALDIATGSGGVTVDLPVTASRRTRTRLIGTIGDGRGSVEIDTGSGGVRILARPM
jgi:DUF4097 and DUF4098 domain-containing protein YvlB